MLRWMSARIRGIGLQQRIMIYVTAGLLIFSVIYGFLALQAVQQSTDYVFRERLLVARTIAHEVDEELEHRQAVILDASAFISSSSSLDLNSSATLSHLSAICDDWMAFHSLDSGCSVLLADARGRTLWSQPNTALQLVVPAEANPENTVTLDAADPNIIRFVVPLHAGSETTGYVMGMLDRRHMGHALDSALEMAETDYIVELIDHSGQVIASNPPGKLLASAHLQLVNPLWAANESGVRTHTLSNGGHVIAFAPLTILPWSIIVEQRVDDAFLLPRNLLTQFVALGVMALLGGLVLAWVTTRTVVRPVNALIYASSEIARGNLDYPLDTSGDAEVGTLARTFGEMRVNLRVSREEIAQWNHELEARIQQRTRELGALVESSHALTSTLELDIIFDILMKETRVVLPRAEGTALLLLEAETQLLTVRSSYGFDAAECAQMRIRVGEGLAGHIFARQEAMQVCTTDELDSAQANLSPDNRSHFLRAIGERAAQSAVGVPLVSKGVRLGVLVLYNFAQPAAFTDNDVPVLQALADQAAAAIENARLYTELQQKEALRALLLERVIDAQEQEHKRIARELHDEFAQTLTALSINLQSTVQTLPPDWQDLKHNLQETQSRTAQMLKEISQWILELRPTVLDDLGLVPAIRWYAENHLEQVKAKVAVEAVGFKRRLPQSVETALFRIVQEAVTNAAKYAKATHVEIRLKNRDGYIRIEVEDDGIGFDADDALSLKDGIRGLGLLGMRERATLLGGTLAIDAHRGSGTCVRVEVPWTETA